MPVGDYLGRFGSTSHLFKVAINRGKIAEVLTLESLVKWLFVKLSNSVMYQQQFGKLTVPTSIEKYRHWF